MELICLGGGDIGSGETAAIDRLFAPGMHLRRRRVLFIPTASQDSEEYVKAVNYGFSRLRIEVDVLRLYHGDNLETCRRKVADCDGVYVGGGNTKSMLSLWRAIGIEKVLRDAARTGKPVGGLSAGAICWFRVANSDWPTYERIPDMRTAPLAGLNWVNLAVCPHTKDEPFRLGDFQEMMEVDGGIGVGIDDGAALHIRGDRYRILSVRDDSAAHLFDSLEGKIRHRIIPVSETFAPLEDLQRGVI